MKKQQQSTVLVIILAAGLFALPVQIAAEQYTYDSQGRVQRVVYEDGSYEEYQYDSNGNITSVKQHKSTQHAGSGNASGEGGTTQASQGQEGDNTTQSAMGQGEGNTTESSQEQEQGGSTAAQSGGGSGMTNVPDSEETSGSILEQAKDWIDKLVNDTSRLTVGKVYKKGVLNYKITSIEKRTVQVVSVVKGKTSKKKYTVPAKVRIEGCTLKVTAIGPKAFNKCSKCKKIVLKSKTIKRIHKNAFKGLKKGTVVQVPKKYYKKYLKYLKKTKSYKQLKIKKSLL